jgi:hypothetical protein
MQQVANIQEDYRQRGTVTSLKEAKSFDTSYSKGIESTKN